MTWSGGPARAARRRCWPSSSRRASRGRSPSSSSTSGTCRRCRSASISSTSRQTPWRENKGEDIMHAVTVKEATQNLERLLTQVLEDAEPTIVVLESGEQVVVVPLDEYTAWQ